MTRLALLPLAAAAALLLAGCGSGTSTAPAAPSPAPVAAGESALDRIDAALSLPEKLDYATALVKAVPAVQARLDKHGDRDTAAKYIARDGVRLCEVIASGESDAVVAKQAAARFEVSASAAAAVRKVTEQRVCSKVK